MPGPKSTVVGGVAYRSFTEACAAYGHSSTKVRHRLKADPSLSLFEALQMKTKESKGAKKHPNYGCWNAMRSRCYSKGTPSYSLYGAVGITMCERWKNDFWAFVVDMGMRPSPEHSVDRKLGAMVYCKENCRWATHAQQHRNLRTNVRVAGYECLKDAADAAGMNPDTLRYRLSVLKLSYAQAIRLPVNYSRDDAAKLLGVQLPLRKRYKHSVVRAHCKHGHSLSGDNVRHYTFDGRAHRACRTCERERTTRQWTQRVERKRLEREAQQ